MSVGILIALSRHSCVQQSDMSCDIFGNDTYFKQVESPPPTHLPGYDDSHAQLPFSIPSSLDAFI